MSKFSVLSAGVAALLAVGMLAPGGASAATPTQVTITATSLSSTYGGVDPALTYTVTGLAKGDDLTRKPTCSVPAHATVGRYVIRCSGATAASTYKIRYVAGVLEVGKAPLAIAANYQLKHYATADPTSFTYSSAGLVRGDTFSTTPTCAVAGPHTAAGRYLITCSGADAGPNYSIDYYDGYYDILKSLALVTAAPTIVYYGAQEPSFDWTVTGLKDGEKLTSNPVCGVKGAHTHVGSYPIGCTGARASSNYDLVVSGNQFTVLQTNSVVVGEQPTYRYGLLGPLVGPTGADLVATLKVALGGAYSTYEGASVVFTSGSTTLCTATTSAGGRATCTLDADAAQLVQRSGYTVTYAGNDDIAGSRHDVTG